MTMPIDLVLVRHGESEGNVANKRSRRGDNAAFTPEFRARHSSSWRLTDRGLAQAHAAGKWIRKNLALPFDRHYTSAYIRAMETAALLALPAAQWYLEFYLRERDWGDMDVMPDDERRARFSEAMRRREVDALFWAPPNGESLASACLRQDRVFDTLHRECSSMRVLMVLHGETMWAQRIRLERLTPRQFRELDESSDPRDHIYNCQILHFTRRDPKKGTLSPHLNWMRSICPWDLARSRNEWETIVRPRYSSADLAREVRRVHRMIRG